VIRFHPDENMLLEYSAGTLDPALAIAVKAHLSMCTKCQASVKAYTDIGAQVFDTAERHDAYKQDEKESFKALMQHIRASEKSGIHVEQAKIDSPPKHKRKTADPLPEIVQRLLPSKKRLKWRRVSPSLKQANLSSGQDKYEVCLHKIRKGGKVAEHDHNGREATVVLRGAFSDENGTYKRGDFLLKEPGDTHRPTATQDQDCLCLSVCEAPVKLTGLLGKIINPFLPFHPN